LENINKFHDPKDLTNGRARSFLHEEEEEKQEERNRNTYFPGISM